jgi:hypothetical protein
VHAMKSALYATKSDPQSICLMLAVVRAVANITGDSEISLRIALFGEKCDRCQRVCDMFIEPAGVCTVCWSILILGNASNQLKKPSSS